MTGQEKPEKAAKLPSVPSTNVYRLSAVGPIACLLAVPAAVVPRDFSGLGVIIGACGVLLAVALLGVLTGLPIISQAADVVVDRTVCAKHNWEVNTLRSFIETFSILHVTFHIFQQTKDASFAAVVGGLTGAAIVLIGECLTSQLRYVEQRLQLNVKNTAKRKESWKNVELFSMENFFMGGVIITGLCVRNIHRLEEASSLAATILASIILVTAAQVSKYYSPTNLLGSIVQDRVINGVHNWKHHTFRSSLELSVYLSSIFYCRWLGEDIYTSAFVGTLAAGIGCVIGECLVSDQFTLDSLQRRQASLQSKINSDIVEFRGVENVKPELMELREECGVTVPTSRLPTRVQNKIATMGSAIKYYDFEEVRKHNKLDDLWVMVEGQVYDITAFVSRHPGGWLPLINMAGKDATDVMAEYHPAAVFENILPKFHIGVVKDYKVSPITQGYREIRQELLRRGLFETSMTYYVFKSIGLLTLWAISVSLVVFLPKAGLLVHIVAAVGIGAFWQQLAFIGHDVGHNSISHNRKKDLFWGTLLGNALMGISLGWWKRSHNTHHVTCNSVEHDPDIQHLPMLCVSSKLFGKFWSTYHEKFFITDAVARFFVSYQHLLFYPIMGVARFNLYAQSWLLLLSKRGSEIEYRKMEILSLSIFFAWYIAMLSFLPTWLEVAAFVLISHASSGLLHVQICISHFAMPTYHGHAYNDDTDDWFKVQLETSMNVECSESMDWFHGGLQFQIEHHLFPRLPRHNLRIAHEMVKVLCEKHNLHYHSPDFHQANVELLACLKKTALEARMLKKGDAGFYTSPIWEGLNAQG
mmetsp:Transcript_14839/g.17404  ORF Transcript_14839/g.17404 Transcript_14839/m.17404 type:complete len:812 (-) Transcript_14839:241-2676(-)|eukprot:CAMPEP_0204830572 /NCGR_PEP_ID=MMETSP1346-20131115/8881_1 /ASSEMBLY_ACC=CAM_ASM_000771 /TAXON_ID=215587 /ORGANISM="Aplanochytrium stocchinoi, Strain GSBS06" /LENGTH=811 /DNA_ID=CAMNT_0051960957 /DNA_START=49 /DNA_END=2484 /DNA_ORIENTATION=+